MTISTATPCLRKIRRSTLAREQAIDVSLKGYAFQSFPTRQFCIQPFSLEFNESQIWLMWSKLHNNQMKILLVILSIFLLTHSQPSDVPTPFPTAQPLNQAQFVNQGLLRQPLSKVVIDPNAPPAASAPADSASTESAPPKAQFYIVGGSNYVSPFDQANNAWNALSALGGGCCDNCNKICGLAFKKYGTSEYLTNVNNVWLRFQSSSNPAASQVFTIGQNADCTWYVQNGGYYLSTVNSNGGNWVSFKNVIGSTERWYLERHGSHIHIQSAAYSGRFWQSDAYGILRYDYGAGMLTSEFFPCDKTWGWN